MNNEIINDKSQTIDRDKGFRRFIVFSMIGLLLYFVPITINGNSKILIDHGTDLLRYILGSFLPYYTLIIVIWGGLSPFIKGKWKESLFDFIFSVFKFLGIIVGVMAVFNIGPERLLEDDMIPFLFNSLVVPIGLIIPITLLSLSFMTDYGLLEFASVFMEPIMRPIWKTPGSSAIDAVVSFTGGYNLAMLVTNDLYLNNVYTAKEASIIATGFSTVAIGFLLIVGNTLDLMSHWNLFFISTLVITFAVTAVTARLYPLRSMDDTYRDGSAPKDIKREGSLFKIAVSEAVDKAAVAEPIHINMFKTLTGEGFQMANSVMSSILSVGLLGLVLANFTPIFDLLAYLFYPITALFKVPEPMLAAKATALGVAEMFLPALLAVGAPLQTKFIVAVVSVTSVLFFSASIPALLSTDIPLSLKDIVIIWFERAALSLIMVIPIAYIFL